MGDQTTARVSEDSSDDHVYMMLWILDFLGADFVVQFLYLFGVGKEKCFFMHRNLGLPSHMGPCTAQDLLCGSTMRPCHCFLKDIFRYNCG